MCRDTSLAACIIVVIATLSASAQIQVPEGFVEINPADVLQFPDQYPQSVREDAVIIGD